MKNAKTPTFAAAIDNLADRADMPDIKKALAGGDLAAAFDIAEEAARKSAPPPANTAGATRRGLIAGMVATAFLPAATGKSSALEADPIFAAIAAHREADDAWGVACNSLSIIEDQYPGCGDGPKVPLYRHRKVETVQYKMTDDELLLHQRYGAATGSIQFATSVEEIEQRAATLPEADREYWLADRMAAWDAEAARSRRHETAIGWRAAKAREIRADRAAYAAAAAVYDVEPSTIAGVIALLQYVTRSLKRSDSFIGQAESDIPPILHNAIEGLRALKS